MMPNVIIETRYCEKTFNLSHLNWRNENIIARNSLIMLIYSSYVIAVREIASSLLIGILPMSYSLHDLYTSIEGYTRFAIVPCYSFALHLCIILHTVAQN